MNHSCLISYKVKMQNVGLNIAFDWLTSTKKWKIARYSRNIV